MPRPRKPILDGLVSDLSREEVCQLVSLYYQVQDYRISSSNRVKARTQDAETPPVLVWAATYFDKWEAEIKRAFEAFVAKSPAGMWLVGNKGIGNVISAGLLAHIDITKCKGVQHLWSFAGYNPNMVWNKGQKRPFNLTLKTLCWNAGECLVKVSGKEDAFYGQIYKRRKEFETANNEIGLYAEQAKKKLEKFKIGKDTQAYGYYASGKLPPAHIHARAKRYAVKMLLSHFYVVLFESTYNKRAPLPPIFHMEPELHKHVIYPPNWISPEE